MPRSLAAGTLLMSAVLGAAAAQAQSADRIWHGGTILTMEDKAILSKDPTAVDPRTIDMIKVTETIKEGKTIFTLAPGQKAEAPASIMPLLTAMAAVGGHDHAAGDCPSDAIAALAGAMAGGTR
jgi:hypothetical protein